MKEAWVSACVCPAASEERAWAPLPASSRAESQPPSPSAGTRGKRTGAPTRRSGLIASSSPPQESGSALRLGSRPGVGPPSGYCTADRGASAASPARRDPLVKASGQTTVAVRTPPPSPDGGRERPLATSELAHCAERPSCLFFNPTPPTKAGAFAPENKCSLGEEHVQSQASGLPFGGGGPAFPAPTPTLHSELAARSLEPKAQPP